jgi:hypothetical protein
MRSPWPPIAALACVSVVAACAAAPAPHCATGQQAAIQDLVYFGTDKPTGRVTPEEWTQFLGEVVTPRFPQGFSVWQASGQWRSASGAIVQEPSYVLSLVHPPGVAVDQAIEELVASYKERFHQEAVLRVRSGACTSF